MESNVMYVQGRMPTRVDRHFLRLASGRRGFRTTMGDSRGLAVNGNTIISRAILGDGRCGQ